jgi:hypothetical protein
MDDSSIVILQEKKPMPSFKKNPLELPNNSLSKPPRKLEPIANRTKGDISQPQIATNKSNLKPSNSQERISYKNITTGGGPTI